ncbi:MAG: protein kinase [Planctomycetaceae bacterium]|nr:protein kinase [Planctomycetaceae bacterium]
MEPPSRQLLDVLSRYDLATPADVRRCRPQVKRLARDLPTFDSVWIDALTQARVLTPFQAKLLESDHPQQLQVGPCVLVDEWEKDGDWTLRLARHRTTKQKCLLTFVNVPAEGLPKALQAVRDVIARQRGLSHPSVIVPQGCDESDDKLVVVSPHIAGPTLKHLLVRRGRFPTSVVIDIAWQLIDGLASLQEREVVHGDITLTNVRLTPRGQTVLLHPGVLPAVGSRVSIHATHGPESYDGIAPELISTSRTATHQSDLYALGCLLWQLLAGRPPYPTGDPLAKLSAHQTKPMDDVRRWVPDTPEHLATLIAKLTDKTPEKRGAGFCELRKEWPLGKRLGRQRLAQFHSSFGTVVPRRGDVHRSAARFPTRAAMAALFILGGLSLSLLDAGARNELLRLAGHEAAPPNVIRVGSSVGDDASAREATAKPLHGLLAFPTQSSNGVIELNSAGPYDVTTLSTDRPLVIRAAEGVSPQVMVQAAPLRLSAPTVQVDGIRFVSASETTPALLLAVQSLNFAVSQCRFEGPNDQSVTKTPVAVAWKVTDTANPTGGKFLMRNTFIDGSLHGLDTHTMPRSLAFDNCLKVGAGALIRLSHEDASVPLRVQLRQTTLRNTGGAIRWNGSSPDTSMQPMVLTAENCVFDLTPGSAGLLEFVSQSPPSGWDRMLQITGQGSVLRQESSLAVADVTSEFSPTEVETSELRIDGLLLDAFEFAGPNVQDPRHSVVVNTQAPRMSPTPPGIDATKLTSPTTKPLVQQAARP